MSGDHTTLSMSSSRLLPTFTDMLREVCEYSQSLVLAAGLLYPRKQPYFEAAAEYSYRGTNAVIETTFMSISPSPAILYQIAIDQSTLFINRINSLIVRCVNTKYSVYDVQCYNCGNMNLSYKNCIVCEASAVVYPLPDIFPSIATEPRLVYFRGEMYPGKQINSDCYLIAVNASHVITYYMTIPYNYLTSHIITNYKHKCKLYIIVCVNQESAGQIWSKLSSDKEVLYSDNPKFRGNVEYCQKEKLSIDTQAIISLQPVPVMHVPMPISTPKKTQPIPFIKGEISAAKLAAMPLSKSKKKKAIKKTIKKTIKSIDLPEIKSIDLPEIKSIDHPEIKSIDHPEINSIDHPEIKPTIVISSPVITIVKKAKKSAKKKRIIPKQKTICSSSVDDELLEAAIIRSECERVAMKVETDTLGHKDIGGQTDICHGEYINNITQRWQAVTPEQLSLLLDDVEKTSHESSLSIIGNEIFDVWKRSLSSSGYNNSDININRFCPVESIRRIGLNNYNYDLKIQVAIIIAGIHYDLNSSMSKELPDCHSENIARTLCKRDSRVNISSLIDVLLVNLRDIILIINGEQKFREMIDNTLCMISISGIECIHRVSTIQVNMRCIIIWTQLTLKYNGKTCLETAFCIEEDITDIISHGYKYILDIELTAQQKLISIIKTRIFALSPRIELLATRITEVNAMFPGRAIKLQLVDFIDSDGIVEEDIAAVGGSGSIASIPIASIPIASIPIHIIPCASKGKVLNHVAIISKLLARITVKQKKI